LSSVLAFFHRNRHCALACATSLTPLSQEVTEPEKRLGAGPQV